MSHSTLSPDMIVPKLPAGLSQVSDAELAQFADLIYRRTGIRVSPHKKTLLSNRLRRRLRTTGIETFAAYYQHLTALSPKDPEWDAFLQEVTTHETYLFRDEVQWNWFISSFLPQCAAEVKAGLRPASLRIWSAACSTGDEPTTAACCIAAHLPDFARWKVSIVATDIGVGALEQARSGVFGERSMRLVPDDFKKRFFAKQRDALVWQAKPVLLEMIDFRQHNLIEPLRERSFDLVIVKNVLIYFDADSKRRVVTHVRSAIRPGGLLLSGAAEGVSEMVRDYQRVHPWLFRKPADG